MHIVQIKPSTEGRTVTHFDKDGVVVGYTAVPRAEWKELGNKIAKQYNLYGPCSRTDVINLITALTVALEEL